MRRAKGADAKAQALYNVASYFYKKSDLKLYNYGMWRSFRSILLSYAWVDAHATGTDNQALQDHVLEHETMARAWQLCEEIVRKYPNSKVAPLAAYRGACAVEKLGNMNELMRRWDKPRGYSKRASELMKLVHTKWPNHELATDAKKYGPIFAELGQYEWGRE